MRGKHIIALSIALALAGCTSPEPGFWSRTMRSAQVPPAVEEIDSIPVDDLSTSGTTALDESRPCGSVPRAVVAPAGFADPHGADTSLGCLWLSADNLLLNVSSYNMGSMADEVDHARRAPRGTYSHLKWLRIDRHYAVESIHAGDSASACSLTVDVRSPKAVRLRVYRADPRERKAVDTDPRKAAEAFCPIARRVAWNLLRHFER